MTKEQKEERIDYLKRQFEMIPPTGAVNNARRRQIQKEINALGGVQK